MTNMESSTIEKTQSPSEYRGLREFAIVVGAVLVPIALAAGILVLLVVLTQEQHRIQNQREQTIFEDLKAEHPALFRKIRAIGNSKGPLLLMGWVDSDSDLTRFHDIARSAFGTEHIEYRLDGVSVYQDKLKPR